MNPAPSPAAGHQCGEVLHVSHNVTQDYLLRPHGKPYAAVMSANSLKIAVLREAVDHLHSMVSGNSEILRKRADASKAVFITSSLDCYVYKRQKRIISIESKTHCRPAAKTTKNCRIS